MYANPEGYDRFMGRWSQALAPAFVRFAGVVTGDCVLDLGCGTGSLTAPLARLATVIGCDPLPSYIDHARRRTAGTGAAYVAGVAEALPFADARFDSVLSLLVFQDFADRARAVAEMRRVAKVGGTVAACQWDFLAGMPMLSALAAAYGAVVPDAVRPASARADSETQLGEVWRAAGFADTEAATLAVSLSFAGFDDLWLPVLGAATPSTARIAALAPDARRAVRDRARVLLLGDQQDGPFALEARAFAVCGRRA